MSYYDNLIENIKDISEHCGWGDYYTALGLPKGLCFGMAAMWGQAYLSDDVATFHKRLQLLTSWSYGLLNLSSHFEYFFHFYNFPMTRLIGGD
ncbi:hypothetical protein EDC55_12232 [Allofrancisella inopinata]|uniref:Uncharacterized protein n=1 Tax=Allofrancisella inopinata TaxID=1085647 RepID=A0AAE6YJA4_9GAMM|nr:hypothetical protein [Allofrancisella inopinata]QIV95749.1 hypothetical protein E4K63_02440 [Allofrancisella inopinata]TDT67975.1 hypothetical protein EDC55_12232 [Allofrancisella inopinata]